VPVEDHDVAVEVRVDGDPLRQGPQDLLPGPLAEPLPGRFGVAEDLKAAEDGLGEERLGLRLLGLLQRRLGGLKRREGLLEAGDEAGPGLRLRRLGDGIL
jgi:hypothetical protein